MTALSVCTWNVGDGGTKDNLAALMDRYDVLALQEMSDRDGFYDYAQNHGWGTIDGDGQGGKRATPTFWRKGAGLTLKQTLVHKLSDAQTVDAGPGPEDIKAKWAVGGQWHVDGYGDAFRFWSCHLVAGSDDGERRKVAKQEIGVLADLFPEAEGACIIGGDFNMEWDEDLTDPMYSHGWKCVHAASGGPYATHGKHTLDHLWARNASPQEQGTRTNASDHDALWATYVLK